MCEEKAPIQGGFSVKNRTKILKTYFRSLNIRFDEDFRNRVWPQVSNVILPFSGQISVLTLAEDTYGSKIHRERGGRLTFNLDEFVSILYFLSKKYQEEKESDLCLKNCHPNIFRVRADWGIISILVRWDRVFRQWVVSYSPGMDFNGTTWGIGGKVLSLK